MPEIGRFFGVDPVSEDYMSISTYQFAHNNPIWKIELEGLEGVPVNGIDIINQEPINNVPIPIGDSTAGNYGKAYQLVTRDDSVMQANYPGQALEEAVTAGVQWLVGKLTGSDVSKETSENIQLAANVVILIASKGKNAKATSELTEQVVKKNGDDVISYTGQKIDPKTGQKLGGSGKARTHTVKHSSKKRAKDAARNGGKGTPVKHTKDKKGGPHYHHGTGKKGKGKGTKGYGSKAGKKSDNVHHEYPNN